MNKNGYSDKFLNKHVYLIKDNLLYNKSILYYFLLFIFAAQTSSNKWYVRYMLPVSSIEM